MKTARLLVPEKFFTVAIINSISEKGVFLKLNHFVKSGLLVNRLAIIKQVALPRVFCNFDPGVELPQYGLITWADIYLRSIHYFCDDETDRKAWNARARKAYKNKDIKTLSLLCEDLGG